MYKFCSELQGFGALNRDEASAVIFHLVEAFAIADTGYLRTHPNIPSLYESGVYYCRDDRGSEVQWWDIPSIRTHRCADCKGLAAWRIAELRLAGYPAIPLIVTRDGSLFHVQVKVGSTIDDPSERLGMHSNGQ